MKWQRFPQKACIFLEGYQKKQKNKDFGLFNPRLRQDFKIFGFFGTSSGNANVFHKKIAFSWRVPKKTKILDFSGLLRQDSKIFACFGFFGTSSGNGNVFHQKLAFSWRGTKKHTKKKKKNKDFGLFNPRFAKTLKSLFFLVCLVPPHKMATFSTKSLNFPGAVPKNTKKNKDFGLFRPRLRQDSKIFDFLVLFGTSS